MSRWYRFLYKMGFKPWEEDQESLTPQFNELVELEEQDRELPYGPALDLGCGTGRWSVVLANRGWNVVGIDVVPDAIDLAQHRAASEDVDIRFVEGDVTALRDAAVGENFSFLLDVECFNHLNDTQRKAMGQEINAVSSPDATMLILVWSRARRGPLPPGASHEDLETAFPGWQVVDKYPYSGDLPRPLKRISPHWYRLARL